MSPHSFLSSGDIAEVGQTLEELEDSLIDNLMLLWRVKDLLAARHGPADSVPPSPAVVRDPPSVMRTEDVAAILQGTVRRQPFPPCEHRRSKEALQRYLKEMRRLARIDPGSCDCDLLANPPHLRSRPDAD